MKLKRVFKYLTFLLLLTSLGFFYGFSNKKNDRRNLQKPQVKFEAGDNNFLTHSMVNKLLIQNVDSVQKLAKSKLDLHQLENLARSNPYIEKATLFMSVEGVLSSIIKQRKPIARVLDESGDYYIDSQGTIVPLSNQYTARVPLITGVNQDEDLTEIYKLLQLILADDFFKKEIIGIHRRTTGNYFFAVRSGNYKIEFGDFMDASHKFKKLKAFYSKALKDETIKQYKTINVKYHNQVVGVK